MSESSENGPNMKAENGGGYPSTTSNEKPLDFKGRMYMPNTRIGQPMVERTHPDDLQAKINSRTANIQQAEQGHFNHPSTQNNSTHEFRRPPAIPASNPDASIVKTEGVGSYFLRKLGIKRGGSR